jgi:CRP-like cAMP-binding protein
MMKSHELFRSLSFEEVELISTFSASKSYQQGDFVFRRKTYASHFFVVVEGRVNLMLPTADGESSLVVGRMNAGDIFGISPLLGFDRYTTRAQCAEPCTILAIEVAPFRKILEQNSTVGLAAMEVIARSYFSRYIEILSRFQNLLEDLAVAT